MVGIFTQKNSSPKQVNLPTYVGCSYLMTTAVYIQMSHCLHGQHCVNTEVEALVW